MKNILVAFFALPLLIGCQIIGDAESKEQLKVEIQASVEDAPAEVIQTMKPVVCIEQAKLLNHLNSMGEKPLAIWHNNITEYPAMLLANKDTGTISVLEYIMGNEEDEVFKDVACLVSEGVGFQYLNDDATTNYKIKFQKTP